MGASRTLLSCSGEAQYLMCNTPYSQEPPHTLHTCLDGQCCGGESRDMAGQKRTFRLPLKYFFTRAWNQSSTLAYCLASSIQGGSAPGSRVPS